MSNSNLQLGPRAKIKGLIAESNKKKTPKKVHKRSCKKRKYANQVDSERIITTRPITGDVLSIEKDTILPKSAVIEEPIMLEIIDGKIYEVEKLYE